MTRHQHVLALLLVLGCRQAARDAAFDDPAQASTRVRAMVDSCGGVMRVLERLHGSRVTGRLLAGLVDEAISAARCDNLRAAIQGSTPAHQLARARLDDGKPALALAALTHTAEPAIRYRRAELLDRLGRSDEALRELADVVLDDQAASLARLLRVSSAAKAMKLDDVARAIEQAPLAEQPRLAHRAVEDAPVDGLALLAQTGTLELAVAAADRLEPLHGPAAVLPARERIVKLDPAVAEHWDALGRARIAAGQLDEALAAWDRAIEIAPAQPAFRIAPIRALAIAGEPARARSRAGSLAKQARTSGDVELLIAASAGAAAAGDGELAIALARDARSKRSRDGRLAFLVAQRLAEAGQVADAADAYVELLVCGAHGRAWHRHEVAGKLRTLAGTSADARTVVLAALDAKRTCEPVDTADLAPYVTGLRER